MENFFYNIPTKVSFGKGAIDDLPGYISEYGDSVLLVYGGGSIKRTGLYDRIIKILDCSHISHIELSGVEPNPRLTTVKKGVQMCLEHDVKVILPVGGGSTIDCSKAIAAGACYDGDPWDLVGHPEKIENAMPIIAVATMAATGSEMDPFAVITNEETKQKKDIASDLLYPAYAILDPEYTFSVPAYQTAAGVADIMNHIFEVYFAYNGDTYMQDRMMEALLKTLIKYGPVAVSEPDNYDARANILWASEWAINGFIACGKDGPWPAHSIEHQLSAYYDITHGHGLAIITPVLMDYILNEKSLPVLVNYGVNVWDIEKTKDPYDIAREAISKTQKLYEDMGLTSDLGELGVPYEKDFDEMAEKAASEDLEHCRVPLTKSDVVEIYRRCFKNVK